jgi:hypothetical protein
MKSPVVDGAFMAEGAKAAAPLREATRRVKVENFIFNYCDEKGNYSAFDGPNRSSGMLRIFSLVNQDR